MKIYLRSSVKWVPLFLVFLFPPSYFPQQQSLWDHFPEEIKNKNSFKRFEWFYRQRAVPFDTIPSSIYLSELEKERTKQKNQDAFNLAWTPVGPKGILSGFPSHWGEMSGRVRGLAVSPVNYNVVYAGAASGGLWKTTNGGTSWANIGDNLASLTFGAIAIDPNNASVIYAGAGEAIYNFLSNIYDGKGLYKSTDAGATWTQNTTPWGNTTHFSQIAVSPHNSNLVFAALASGYWFYGNPTNEGIWRSTNAGSTWTRVLNVPDAFDVAIHPVNDTIYAAIGGGVSTSGFYRSTDQGVNWTQLNTGLPSTSEIDRIQITVAQSSPYAIYAVIYNSSNTRVYKSTNSGTNWSQISAGTNLGGNYGSGWVDQGFYDLCIAVNPSNANEVYLGNVEMHKTTNGSNFSVVRISGGSTAWDCPTHVDLHKIVFAPSNNNYIYVGCDGGVYKSTTGGTSWSSANNALATIQFYRMDSHPTLKNYMIGGSQDNGNFRTTNGGTTAWNYVTTGDGMECFFDCTTPNTYVYYSTQYGNLGKSSNGGATVSWIYYVGGAWLTPFLQHPTNNQYLYTAANDVFRSINAGASFTAIAVGVSPVDDINTMAISPVNPANMMIAGSGSYTVNPVVKVSTDGGFNWINVTGNIPGTTHYISRVAADPVSASTFYIVRSGYSAGNKIYKTTNLGVNWTNVSGDLPNVPHNDFFVDPNNTAHYYAANDLGVYRSVNGGTNWAREGYNFPFVPAIDLDYVVISPKRYLRAATYGRSAFETDIDSIIPVELTSFYAKVINNNVELNWTTATELNNRGFEIERSIDRNYFEVIGQCKGNGTTAEPHSYSYVDRNVSGTLYYRLKQIDFDGSCTYSDVINADVTGLKEYYLGQNYPNPFNPITRIKYKVPVESNVKMLIYDDLGREVVNLVNEVNKPGEYEAVWNAEDMASGIYFYKIEAIPVNGGKSFTSARKMIVIK